MTPFWDLAIGESVIQWVTKLNPVSPTRPWRRPKKLNPHNSLREEKQPYSLHSLILTVPCRTAAGGRCERWPSRERETGWGGRWWLIVLHQPQNGPSGSCSQSLFFFKSETYSPTHLHRRNNKAVLANLLATSTQRIMGVLWRISWMLIMAQQKLHQEETALAWARELDLNGLMSWIGETLSCL